MPRFVAKRGFRRWVGNVEQLTRAADVAVSELAKWPETDSTFDVSEIYLPTLRKRSVALKDLSADALPAAVAEYYAASARGDTDGLAECFTEDATVSDESREWRGL